MPDLERQTRNLETHLADEQQKPIIEAYHRGLDRARKEVAVVASVAAIVFVVLRVIAGG